jgi:hypothetical protein
MLEDRMNRIKVDSQSQLCKAQDNGNDGTLKIGGGIENTPFKVELITGEGFAQPVCLAGSQSKKLRTSSL